MPIAGPQPPEINVTVTGYFTINTSTPGEFKRENYHVADAVHWIHGSHELAFGGDFLRMSVDLSNSFRQAGRFRFRGTSYSGDPRSDFLLGPVERFHPGRRRVRRSPWQPGQPVRPGQLARQPRAGGQPGCPMGSVFALQRRARPHGVLPARSPSERFPNAPTGYLFAGDPGCPEGGSKATWWNSRRESVSPITSAGAAEPPCAAASACSTSRRSWKHTTTWSTARRSARRSSASAFRSPIPYQGIRNPFPAEFAPTPPPRDVEFEKPVLGVSYATDWKPARQLSWNLTLEHQLRTDLLVRGAYVGSKGTHLGINTDVNAARYFPGSEDIDADLRRPYSDFTQFTQNVSGANSIYNSLQLGLDKRFSHGFTLGRQLHLRAQHRLGVVPYGPRRHQCGQSRSTCAPTAVSPIST